MNCIYCHRPETEHHGPVEKRCPELWATPTGRQHFEPIPDTSASFARQDREKGWEWAGRLAEIVWQFWWEHKLTPEQEKAYLDYRKAKEAR